MTLNKDNKEIMSETNNSHGSSLPLVRDELFQPKCEDCDSLRQQVTRLKIKAELMRLIYNYPKRDLVRPELKNHEQTVFDLIQKLDRLTR